MTGKPSPAPPRSRGRPYVRRPAPRPPMASTSLYAWRERLKLNVTDATLALGISRNTFAKYEGGESPIPLLVALACAAIAHGLPPIE